MNRDVRLDTGLAIVAVILPHHLHTSGRTDRQPAGDVAAVELRLLIAVGLR